MSDPLPSLTRRLELAGIDLLGTDATLATYSTRKRDEATPLTGKEPKIILHAIDEGRHVKGCDALRNLRLRITGRFNVLTEGGTPAGLDTFATALEHLLDTTNLTAALDLRATRGLACLLAIRRAGNGERTMSHLREQIYEIECRCVPYELTVEGSVPDGAWVDGDGTQLVDGDGKGLVF